MVDYFDDIIMSSHAALSNGNVVNLQNGYRNIQVCSHCHNKVHQLELQLFSGRGFRNASIDECNMTLLALFERFTMEAHRPCDGQRCTPRLAPLFVVFLSPLGCCDPARIPRLVGLVLRARRLTLVSATLPLCHGPCDLCFCRCDVDGPVCSSVYSLSASSECCVTIQLPPHCFVTAAVVLLCLQPPDACDGALRLDCEL